MLHSMKLKNVKFVEDEIEFRHREQKLNCSKVLGVFFEHAGRLCHEMTEECHPLSEEKGKLPH